MVDYYAAYGIPYDSSIEEITKILGEVNKSSEKNNIRKLKKRFNKASKTLTNPKKKKDYDFDLNRQFTIEKRKLMGDTLVSRIVIFFLIEFYIELFAFLVFSIWIPNYIDKIDAKKLDETYYSTMEYRHKFLMEKSNLLLWIYHYNNEEKCGKRDSLISEYNELGDFVNYNIVLPNGADSKIMGFVTAMDRYEYFYNLYKEVKKAEIHFEENRDSTCRKKIYYNHLNEVVAEIKKY